MWEFLFLLAILAWVVFRMHLAKTRREDEVDRTRLDELNEWLLYGGAPPRWLDSASADPQDPLRPPRPRRKPLFTPDFPATGAPLTEETLWPALAVFLVLSQVAVAGISLWRADRILERLPPGFDTPALDRPVLPFLAALVVAGVTVIAAFRAHPWTTKEPHRRLPSWVPMALALGGLVLMPARALLQSQAGGFSLMVLMAYLVIAVFVLQYRPTPPTPPEELPWRCGVCTTWNAALDNACRGCSAPRAPELEPGRAPRDPARG